MHRRAPSSEPGRRVSSAPNVRERLRVRPRSRARAPAGPATARTGRASSARTSAAASSASSTTSSVGASPRARERPLEQRARRLGRGGVTAPRAAAVDVPGQLGGQRVLPLPARAGHRDDRARARRARAPSARAARRARRRGPRAACASAGSSSAAARPPAGGSSAGSWRRIAVVQRRAARARLDADLVEQPPARVAVGLERLGLAPAAVEREHQLRRRAARASGARPTSVLQLGHRRRRAGRPRGRPPRASRAPPAAAPRAGRSRPARTARSARSASGGPRHSASASRSTVGRLLGLRRRQRRPRLLDQPLEALGVELVRAHAQAVARRRRDQDLGVAERLAQPRDVHLHRLHRAGRRVLAPERDRQPLGAHRLVRVQQQHGQHRARLPADSCDDLPCSLRTSNGPRIRNSIVARDDATGIRATPPASKSSVRGHVEAQGRRGTLSGVCRRDSARARALVASRMTGRLVQGGVPSAHGLMTTRDAGRHASCWPCSCWCWLLPCPRGQRHR